MPRPLPPSPFRRFNSSPEVIRLVVLMYVRFPLSLRNVEDLLAERGIEVSYETVRFWWNRFGPMFAAEIRKKRVDRMRAFTHWRWHLDEVYVRINGVQHYLWRAVDHEGEVLESFVTKERDKAAALSFIRKAMKRHGSPRAITTDGLRSYKAALKEVGAADKQEVGRWANNRVENSHLPFRRRERAMTRFRRMHTLQKFSSVHASFHNHFAQERHLTDRDTFKANRSAALAEWRTLAA
ncbi:MAG: IS6 family transposase [Caulobacteraceae bacterium]|nr:IS6 family transposase [Caulobacter sp.]